MVKTIPQHYTPLPMVLIDGARKPTPLGPPQPAPDAIEDNAIYRDLQDGRHWLDQLYLGNVLFVILTGPAGIGKTQLLMETAKKHRRPWITFAPSAREFIEILRANRFSGMVINVDDFDKFWQDPALLSLAKRAFDDKPIRKIRHDVHGPNKVEEFEFAAGLAGAANTDFDDPAQFSGSVFKTFILPLKSRGKIQKVSFDPWALYIYTAWVATHERMLLGLHKKAGKGKAGRTISLAESNEVLEHFANYAPMYVEISPRKLREFAIDRIGSDKAAWLGRMERQMLPGVNPAYESLIQRVPLPLYQIPPSKLYGERQLRNFLIR